MRVPLAWLREYVDLPADAQAVADLLASIGFPVDGIRERPAISGVVIGRIAALAKHPDADRLQVGEIETGGGTRLTIATAATNVAAGQTIAVATIGAQLPHLKIERRKMRGIESEGMMISAEELDLPGEWFEDGIMQFESDLAPGTDVVERFRLADAVLDVDVTNNRADAMSMIGLARELAAVQKTALRLPDLANPGDRDDGADAPIVSIESTGCVRFVAQRFTGVRVGRSPAWMRIRLALAGQRPIDNVVDISNYVMLETGQPLHFYDDARIPNHHLIVRDAKRDEKLVTLDGVERELDPSALVVTDEREAQAIAGIKGGGASQVSAATTAVLLESANFEGARIRRTSAALGIRTDASTRHEKTLPLILSDYGAARAARLLVEAGATPFAPHAVGAPVTAMPPISFKTSEVKRLLGFDLAAGEIRGHLEALGFGVVQESAERLLLAPPLWRRDVTLGADVVEELARMAGYERIESEIPQVFPHAIESRGYRLERTIARTLSALGYREIISYALHGARVFENLKRAGFAPSSPPVE
ncbi:MAG: phenylalanine--tRNA ligase subunit beta, partial [Vulcanimicrobiaceae bacterium]